MVDAQVPSFCRVGHLAVFLQYAVVTDPVRSTLFVLSREPVIEEAMKTALPMQVPIVVEMGVGRNWLEAH